MSIITGPQKGEIIELEINQSARQRILIGLSWDQREIESLKEKAETNAYKIKQFVNGVKLLITNPELHYAAKKRDGFMTEKVDGDGREEDYPFFDLDLHCYIFDAQGSCVEQIGPSCWEAIDESEKIYHSGEDMDGLGGGDDEQVFIELKDLPENYDSFFVVIKSDSAHKFDSVLNPQARIADSYSNENRLHVKIDDLPGSDDYAFVYAKIFRDGEQWKLHHISEFTGFDQEWETYLKKYL